MNPESDGYVEEDNRSFLICFTGKFTQSSRRRLEINLQPKRHWLTLIVFCFHVNRNVHYIKGEINYPLLILVAVFALPDYERLAYLNNTNERHPLIFDDSYDTSMYRPIIFTKREYNQKDFFDLEPKDFCLTLTHPLQQLLAYKCPNPQESPYILRYFEELERICLAQNSEMCLKLGTNSEAIILPLEKFRIDPADSE